MRSHGDPAQLLGQIQPMAQLHEAIALQINYYNTERIHLALGMSPAAYTASLKIEREEVSGKV
jgi:hypothetical protein